MAAGTVSQNFHRHADAMEKLQDDCTALRDAILATTKETVDEISALKKSKGKLIGEIHALKQAKGKQADKITALEQTKNNHADEITTLKHIIANHASEVAHLEKKISELQGEAKEISRLKEENDNLTKQVEEQQSTHSKKALTILKHFELNQRIGEARAILTFNEMFPAYNQVARIPNRRAALTVRDREWFIGGLPYNKCEHPVVAAGLMSREELEVLEMKSTQSKYARGEPDNFGVLVDLSSPEMTDAKAHSADLQNMAMSNSEAIRDLQSLSMTS